MSRRDAVALPYPDGAFDAAVSTQVYEYVADVSGALGELRRVLRPGGVHINRYIFPRGGRLSSRSRSRAGAIRALDPRQHLAPELRPVALGSWRPSAGGVIQNLPDPECGLPAEPSPPSPGDRCLGRVCSPLVSSSSGTRVTSGVDAPGVGASADGRLAGGRAVVHLKGCHRDEGGYRQVRRPLGVLRQARRHSGWVRWAMPECVSSASRLVRDNRGVIHGEDGKCDRSECADPTAIEEVFSFYRDFRNLPRFLGDVMAVEQVDPAVSRWTIQGPLGVRLAWTIRVIEERPNELIRYRTDNLPLLTTYWDIHFAPGPRVGETEVREVMKAPLGGLGRAALALIGKFPDKEVASNLNRLKQLMETGRVADTSYSVAGKFGQGADQRDTKDGEQ